MEEILKVFRSDFGVMPTADLLIFTSLFVL